jgi:hypothetical protein
MDDCIKIQLARLQVMWTESLQKPKNYGYNSTNSAEKKVSNSDGTYHSDLHSMATLGWARIRRHIITVWWPHSMVKPQGLRYKKDDWTSLNISRNHICGWMAVLQVKLLRMRLDEWWITA